jgi:polyketide synthase 2/polyketide synthase 5
VTRAPVWVFSGQGSQWPGMGRGLLDTEPAFAVALTELDPLIATEAGFSVLDMVRSGRVPEGAGQIQPTLFAMQVALASTWRAHGVEPAAVIGHSMGEVAAAVVAGALTAADGARVICRRSMLLTRIGGEGAMATVALGADATRAALEAAGASDAVSVAVLAAPGSTVVAGATGEVERLVAAWDSEGTPARLIAVDVASHSPQVDPLLDELEASLAALRPAEPTTRFYSTVLDDPRRQPAFDAAYWRDNLRRPVRFATAIRAAADDRHSVFVEVSPHPVVTRQIMATLDGLVREPVVLPTLLRDTDEPTTLRTQLAALHCAGVAVDWAEDHPAGSLADVPPLTFDRRRHWIERGAGAGADRPAAGSGAPATTGGPAPTPGPAAPGLLGRHHRVPGPRGGHLWSADAGTANLPWLADHRVHGRAVLPGAAFAAIALSAGARMLGAAPNAVELVDLELRELLTLEETTALTASLTPAGDGGAHCEIYSGGGAADDASPEEWTLHARASVRSAAALDAPPPVSLNDLAAALPVPVEVAELYASFRARGVEHGPSFAGLAAVRRSADRTEAWARLSIPAPARSPAPGVVPHPALLDMFTQTMLTGSMPPPGEVDTGLVLPVGLGRLRLLGDVDTARYCRTVIDDPNGARPVGSGLLYDADGRPVAEVDGLRFTRHTTAAPAAMVDHWFHGVRWERLEATGDRRDAAGYLVVAAEPAGAAELAEALRAAGAVADVVEPPGAREPVEVVRDTLAAAWAGRTAPSDVVLVAGPPRPDPADRGGQAGPVGPGAPGGPAPAGATAAATAGAGWARRLTGLVQAVLASFSPPPRVRVVTRGAVEVVPGDTADPAQAALLGAVRVLRHEHPELLGAVVDRDPGPAGAEGVAQALLADDPADEVALRDGERFVAGIVTAPLTETERRSAARRVVAYGRDRFALRPVRPGDLDTLALVQGERRAPGPGEVEIRVEAAGLNFRDVLLAMGLLPSSGLDDPGSTGPASTGPASTGAGSTGPEIGFECAGVVSAVGAGVEDVRVGDPVVALALNRAGAFGSFITVPALFVAPRPDTLSPAEAAAVPSVFLTAWYALREVAALGAGERVLIHSATGGTGLAAVQVARMLGAEVLATAGGPEKRAYLRGMGIAHVMDSRSLDFARQTREATGGHGVDVVLNSLSGPAIRAGLETLRPFGRFVELGLRDILDDAPLGLAPFRDSVTFASVNLIELARHRPERFAAMFREVLDAFADGRLAPPPVTTFPLDRATEAFRLMAGARHIGKIVFTLPAEGPAVATLPGAPPAPVRGDGAYIVTGGLRGVGLETAAWLAGHGAGRLVLNGRSAPSEQVRQRLEAIRATGTAVEVVTGDCARPEVAAALVAAAGRDGSRLRGIVHSAMVLDDAVIANVTDAALGRVWHAKATGAAALHEASGDVELDWFVVYSSMAATIGNPGQAAYAAANAWLDAFAAWRGGTGRPTLAVGWGAWGEVGAATTMAGRWETIGTADGLAALGTLLAHGRRVAQVIPGSAEGWVPAAGRGSSLFRHVLRHAGAAEDGTGGGAGGEGDPTDITALLRSAPTSRERAALLETYVAGHLRAVLRLPSDDIDPETPLRSFGFDSLLALELRSRLETGLTITLPPKFVWTYPTLAALATALADRLETAS